MCDVYDKDEHVTTIIRFHYIYNFLKQLSNTFASNRGLKDLVTNLGRVSYKFPGSVMARTSSWLRPMIFQSPLRLRFESTKLLDHRVECNGKCEDIKQKHIKAMNDDDDSMINFYNLIKELGRCCPNNATIRDLISNHNDVHRSDHKARVRSMLSPSSPDIHDIPKVFFDLDTEIENVFEGESDVKDKRNKLKRSILDKLKQIRPVIESPLDNCPEYRYTCDELVPMVAAQMGKTQLSTMALDVTSMSDASSLCESMMGSGEIGKYYEKFEQTIDTIKKNKYDEKLIMRVIYYRYAHSTVMSMKDQVTESLLTDLMDNKINFSDPESIKNAIGRLTKSKLVAEMPLSLKTTLTAMLFSFQ